MKKLLIVVALLVILYGCAHPFIGIQVDTTGPAWCKIHVDVQSCEQQTEHLKFVYSISYDDATGICTINGHIDPVSIKSFSHFVTEKSTFYIYFARNGVVVDATSFLLQSDSAGNRIPMNLKFKSKPFDAVIFTYEFVVMG